MKKKMRRILTAVVAVVFIVSLGALIRQQLQYRRNAQVVDEARQLAKIPAVTTPAPQPSQTGPEEEAEEETDPWAEIDLEALQAVNSDVVGWLAIPGTEVSYPLIRPQNNEAYLKQSWNKTPTSAGSIFLDYRADWDPRSFNTIIYGHNMRNGSMFGSLRQYRKDGYWQEHPDIYLIDSEGVHCYEVFAAWEPRVTDIPFQPIITSEADRQSLIDTALRRSAIQTEAEPTADSQVLTLSTCTGVGYATRWVVQAVLREDG